MPENSSSTCQREECEDRVLGFLSEDKGPYALTPHTVELIPTLEALFPRGGPVQDPVLTRSQERGVLAGGQLLHLRENQSRIPLEPLIILLVDVTV